MRALIRLALDDGDAAQAFETLEWAKSQTMLSYLANRESFHWRRENADMQPLLEKLDRLRARHHWLYRLVHDSATIEADEPSLDADLAASELAACEQEIRQITEQLYLDSAGEVGLNPAPCPGLAQIQARLAEKDLLLAYYDDGEQVSVFAITHQHIQVYRHITASDEIKRLMQKSFFNIRCALTSAPDSTTIQTLSRTFQRLNAQLYDWLLRPLEVELQDVARIFVVPYGRLHYLPFHLLHDGQSYLIEQREVVILPSAGLLTQLSPQRSPGARVLAHSYDGRLPETLHEAALVGSLLPGELHVEKQANRGCLAAAPVQILHIAAHGKHRMDYPELSYLRLADGQLFSDDLLQYDLSYELVILSACETGQAVVTAGEDLIGLGRGVLVAGAGALIASLWSVPDRIAPELMRLFYENLLGGASKSAALRQAQLVMMRGIEELHPAFWGAFQLIGDPRPLSDSGDNK
jgi:CHAT domain-containing protein